MAKWDRMEGETHKAYAAFCAYRDLGAGRSLSLAYQAREGLSQTPERPPSHYRRWSVRWRWVERAGAWDAHEARRQADELAELRLEEQRAIIHERIFNKRSRIEVATKMLEIAREALEQLDPADMKPRDVINMVRVACDQLRKDYESEWEIQRAEQAGIGADGIDWHAQTKELLDELVNVDPMQLSVKYREILKASDKVFSC